MLYNMTDLLNVAYENKFAIGAFNVANSEFVKVVIDAAEAQNSPAIIQIHPLEINLIEDDFIAYVRETVKNSKIPMAIHLDHGGNLQDVVRAIRNGYTSVMIDASHLSYEENIEITKKIVEIAHAVNVSVEAELGTIGVNEGSGEGGSDDILYTDPKQAAEFVKKTGIDSLAVAIGTSHGIYPKTKEHSIKIDRLKAIKKQVSIPLVLHGGSDNADDEIRETTKNGVAKINLASDMKRAFYRQLQKTLNDKPNDYESFIVIPEATKAATELVKKKMDLFGSTGKAQLYK
jgi:fructose-bisphosphate aldolase class II